MLWIDMVSSTWHGKRMQLRQLKHFTIPTSKERRSTWNSRLGSHAEVEEDAEMTEEVDQWEVVEEDETVVETLVLDHTMIEEVSIVCTLIFVNSDKTIFSFNFSQLYIYVLLVVSIVYINCVYIYMSHVHIVAYFFYLLSSLSLSISIYLSLSIFPILINVKVGFASLNRLVNFYEWCNILYYRVHWENSMLEWNKSI